MTQDKTWKDLKLRIKYDANGFVTTDLSTSHSGDLELISGRDNIIQAIRNRLATSHGELASLGHPDYGSKLDDVIGEPNTSDTHRIIETLVKDCILKEPRIEKVIKINAKPHITDHSCVDIMVYIKLRDTPEKLRLVIPFYLEGGL
jgi:phage baseplate assembly protein W